jgi:hypothetical protein
MPCIYVLQLEKGKYYIGSSTYNPIYHAFNYEAFKKNNFNIQDSEWIKLYKPIKFLEARTLYDFEHCDVDKYTIFYMDKYGFDNVRGGTFISVDLEKTSIQNKQPSILFDTVLFKNPNKCIELINDIEIINNLQYYNISLVDEQNCDEIERNLNNKKTYNNLQNIIDDLEIIVNYSEKDIMQLGFNYDSNDAKELLEILPNCRLFFMKTLCKLLCKLSASTLSILQNQKTLSFNEVNKLIITSFNEKPKY